MNSKLAVKYQKVDISQTLCLKKNKNSPKLKAASECYSTVL